MSSAQALHCCLAVAATAGAEAARAAAPTAERQTATTAAVRRVAS